jgi:hypothetical protein
VIKVTLGRRAQKADEARAEMKAHKERLALRGQKVQ